MLYSNPRFLPIVWSMRCHPSLDSIRTVDPAMIPSLGLAVSFGAPRQTTTNGRADEYGRCLTVSLSALGASRYPVTVCGNPEGIERKGLSATEVHD